MTTAFCLKADMVSAGTKSTTVRAQLVGSGNTGFPVSLPGTVPEYIVDSWNTEQGLPNNSVNALLQTRQGYLWVGTSEGLAYFDGIRFTPVRTPDAPGEKPDSITALCEDHEGHLWIGTQSGGILVYVKGHLQRFTTASGLTDDRISNISEDSWHTMWIGTQSGLNCWKNGHFSEYKTREGASLKSITGIHASRSGGLWVTTPTGIYELHEGELELLNTPIMTEETRNIHFLGVYGDRQGNLWGYGDTFLRNLSLGKRYNYFRSTDPSASRVWTICERRNGELWVGTKGRGLFCLNNGEFKSIELVSSSFHNDVRSIIEDTEGDLWVGTSGGGLLRLKQRRFWFIENNQGLSDTPLNSLCTNADGRIWIGSAGEGLFAIQSQFFQPIRTGNLLDFVNHVNSICTDRKGGVWVGTWGSGLFFCKDSFVTQYTLQNGLADDIVQVVYPASTNGVWIGTQFGSIHHIENGSMTSYGISDGLPGKSIHCLLVRHDGSVWVGIEDGGLYHLFDNKFVPFFTGDLAHTTITTLFEDSADRLWIGTNKRGLGCTFSTRLYWCDSRSGLPDDAIYQMIDDEKGDFWIASERGISQVSKTGLEKFARGTSRSLPATLCEQEPGLVGLKCSRYWPGVIRTQDGKLWFATTKGIAILDAPHFTQNNSAPPVLIESVLVDGTMVQGFQTPLNSTSSGRETHQSSPLEISPRMRTLDFQYTSLSFMSPQSIQFRHKLDGYDQDWVDGGNTRKVHYGKLPAGDYTFRVTAKGNDGVWNDQETLVNFVVLPPFWKTWWFTSLLIVFAVGLVSGLVRFIMLRRISRKLERSEQQRALERERTRIAQDMHDEIGSKLTRISFLSELAKTKQPEAQSINAIAETSRDLMATLDELVWAVNPRNDNLEHLATYLGRYADEYFQMTAIECRLEIPQEIRACQLTSEVRHHLFLAFKESLNNVLKHAQATRVQIDMSEGPSVFEIDITDNGCGFSIEKLQTARRDGNGLINLKLRLQSIGGDCIISSSPGKGTTVRLILNLTGKPEPSTAKENR